MIASVYIKNGNIHFYNEPGSLSGIDGIAYELGKPLLNFVCYEQERFDDSMGSITEAFEVPGAYTAMHMPEFKDELKEMLTNMQKHEQYVYLYCQALITAIYNGHPPRMVLTELSEDFRLTVAFVTHEIDYLLLLREKFPDVPSMEYIYMLDLANERDFGGGFFLEQPFKTFYGVVDEPEIAELHEINSIRDLLRFEFIKMVEHDIFIKKCKNCGWFFIPNRRQDAEYCDRSFGETGRKCSEVGAMLRYEKKVAENPILDAHKKAYRRFNSRVRNKKMTQSEFMSWSEEAARKRDECLAGGLPFNEFVAWLEQGRIRKSRSKPE